MQRCPFPASGMKVHVITLHERLLSWSSQAVLLSLLAVTVETGHSLLTKFYNLGLYDLSLSVLLSLDERSLFRIALFKLSVLQVEFVANI